MSDLEKAIAELLDKQRKEEEQDRTQYRHMFWREANNSSTRPDGSLK
jgi:hypothetical protein